jgi:hypothetical protein
MFILNKKQIFLIIFIIIDILFTVGYASQSIISSSNSYYTKALNESKIFITVFYLCIIITILLSVGIILSYVNFKLTSKIILLLTLIIMIITFIIIQVAIVGNSIINIAESKTVGMPETSNGTGYYLILVSTILMFINYILYLFLG